MTAPVMDVPQLVLAHDVAIRRINVVLGLTDGAADSKVCPKCVKPVPVNDAGVILPHQIDGAPLVPGRRHTLSVCRYRPEVGSSESSSVSTVAVA